MLNLKLLQKQEKAKPKTSRREIIKIRDEINETGTNTQTKSTKNQQNKELVL
jgi:hypothetical protein